MGNAYREDEKSNDMEMDSDLIPTTINKPQKI